MYTFTGKKHSDEHVQRMQDEALPKLALKYQPVAKRSKGLPKKKWKDQFLEESWGIYDKQNQSTVQEEE
jgi:hypothetical protein